MCALNVSRHWPQLYIKVFDFSHENYTSRFVTESTFVSLYFLISFPMIWLEKVMVKVRIGDNDR